MRKHENKYLLKGWERNYKSDLVAKMQLSEEIVENHQTWRENGLNRDVEDEEHFLVVVIFVTSGHQTWA